MKDAADTQVSFASAIAGVSSTTPSEEPILGCDASVAKSFAMLPQAAGAACGLQLPGTHVRRPLSELAVNRGNILQAGITARSYVPFLAIQVNSPAFSCRSCALVAT